jgi:hypothetical protein
MPRLPARIQCWTWHDPLVPLSHHHQAVWHLAQRVWHILLGMCASAGAAIDLGNERDIANYVL